MSARSAELTLYPTDGEWYLVRPRRGAGQWFEDPELPFRTSTSLPARLARALINIVARPGEEVLDPVCGTGVLLAEAARIGCRVTGGDLNRKAAWCAQKNFASLGLRGDLRHADALRAWQEREPADVLVGDLPYGIRLREVDLTPFARALPQLARRWALVAHEDLSAALSEAGHPPREVLRVRKLAFTRYVLLGGAARPRSQDEV